jgi:L-iditol 2-dehydrogenase|eukprot:COSAG01_NODE_5087_length_4496_cov_2.007278_3_plen_115_part_00
MGWLGHRHAVDAARVGGRVVLVGIPDGNVYAPLDASLLRRKGLKIKSSRRMGHVFDRAIELAKPVVGGQPDTPPRVDLTTMISHTFKLEQAPEAFAAQAAFQDGVLKTVIHLTD